MKNSLKLSKLKKCYSNNLEIFLAILFENVQVLFSGKYFLHILMYFTEISQLKHFVNVILKLVF